METGLHARTDTAQHGELVSGAGAVRYVAIGDSIARGFQASWPRPWRRQGCGVRIAGIPLKWFDDLPGSYPVVAARMISERLVRDVALETGLTCSGTRTDHLWRDGSGPAPLLRTAFAHPADLVTATLGANDLISMWYRYIASQVLLGPFHALTPARPRRPVSARLVPDAGTVAEVAAAMSARLERILTWIAGRSPSAPIIVTSYHLADGSDETHDMFWTPLVTGIRDAVERCPAATLVDLTSALADEPATVRTISRIDGFHPTPAGQLVIAGAVADEAVRRISETLTDDALDRERAGLR